MILDDIGLASHKEVMFVVAFGGPRESCMTWQEEMPHMRQHCIKFLKHIDCHAKLDWFLTSYRRQQLQRDWSTEAPCFVFLAYAIHITPSSGSEGLAERPSRVFVGIVQSGRLFSWAKLDYPTQLGRPPNSTPLPTPSKENKLRSPPRPQFTAPTLRPPATTTLRSPRRRHRWMTPWPSAAWGAARGRRRISAERRSSRSGGILGEVGGSERWKTNLGDSLADIHMSWMLYNCMV